MEKNFKNAHNRAQVTADILTATVLEIKSGLDNVQPESVGEMLGKAVRMTGLAQLLLIDINDMIKSV